MSNNPELHRQLKVLSDTVAGCQKCDLHLTRTQTVFSRGNPEAKVIFVGEACGEEEQKQGLPFVGRSGQLLDRAIKELGYDPTNDIYVCNVIKCRPPENRRPTSHELQECWGYIEQQLDLLPATVIITLGTTATHTITDQVKPITQLRGSVCAYKSKRVIPGFHPSYLIRSGNENSIHYPTFKDDINKAFKLAKERQ